MNPNQTGENFRGFNITFADPKIPIQDGNEFNQYLCFIKIINKYLQLVGKLKKDYAYLSLNFLRKISLRIFQLSILLIPLH